MASPIRVVWLVRLETSNLVRGILNAIFAVAPDEYLRVGAIQFDRPL